MLHNLPLLSVEELQALFLSESLRFTDGMDNNLPFAELKKIRLNLKAIALELHNRKSLGSVKKGSEG